MQIDTYNKSGVTVLVPVGQLDSSSTPDFLERFKELAQYRKYFVVDLSSTEHMDSRGLGGLVECMKFVGESGGTLKLCGISDKQNILFDITRAYKIFERYQNTREAVNSFGKIPARHDSRGEKEQCP